MTGGVAGRAAGAHVVLALGVLQHPPSDGASFGPDTLDVWSFDHRHRHTRELVCQDDVFFPSVDDGGLVVLMGGALGARDESGAELHAGVA